MLHFLKNNHNKTASKKIHQPSAAHSAIFPLKTKEPIITQLEIPTHLPDFNGFFPTSCPARELTPDGGQVCN